MHHTDRLTLAVRSGIRSTIFRVLRDYATGGQYSIYFSTIFLKVADLLAEQGVINRIETNSGRISYVSLRADYHTDWFPNYNMPAEVADLIRQTFWELFMQGVLAPSSHIRGNDKNLFHLDLDSCDITSYGAQILISSDDRIRVHDPDGYLTIFWSANPPADSEMMRYLMECVQTFKGNHLLATMILLGTASERLVDTLAERLRDALGAAGGGSGWFSNYQSKWAITRKFDEVLKKLQQEYQSELNSARISDRELQAIKLAFEAIRNPRNLIAHEHNYSPTWNEAGGLMHNFVLYFKLVNQIIGVLLANPR